MGGGERRPLPGAELIIFCRYPEPGKTKTRLIPKVGAQTAADIHQKISRLIIDRAANYGARTGVTVTVYFDGGDESKMRAVFGGRVGYRRQSDGDLGRRLAAAISTTHRSSGGAVIAIGADIPEIDENILAAAFASLSDHDAVIGPAADGGYYLIGLNRPQPELFDRIDWGSETVYQSTIDRAQQLGLRVGLLPVLRDIDRPEDLAHWREIERRLDRARPSLSVIIPARNEADLIVALIDDLRAKAECEIIVAEGEGDDRTAELAAAAGAIVVADSGGRAAQCNRAAAGATGDLLFFLHADCRPPDRFDQIIKRTLSDVSVIAGAFTLAIDSARPSLRLIEILANWRSRRLSAPYGDQGIFIRKDDFLSLGGFPTIPIMDDYSFIDHARSVGRVVTAPEKMVTSARRWEKNGVLITTLINQLMIAGFHLGLSPEKLARIYRRG